MDGRFVNNLSGAFLGVWLVLLAGGKSYAAAPPVLETVFPPGGQAGQSVEVTITGSRLDGVRSLYVNAPGLRSQRLEANRFRLDVPAELAPGLYDLWAAGDEGVSAPRTFFVGRRVELQENEPNESTSAATGVSLDAVMNGRIAAAGDFDLFRFEARRGQRLVLECWADRIDSRLRPILELFDAQGRRLAVNRGYFGADPLIDFRVPADGSYVVKVQDLISSGSAEHYYRLDLDAGPRVAFSRPSVVQRGTASRVTLYGWNLGHQQDGTGNTVASLADGSNGGAPTAEASESLASAPSELGLLDRREVEIPAGLAQPSWPWPVNLSPAQAVLEGFPYHLPGSHAALVIGTTDVPVVLDRDDNHSPATAQEIVVPCEVSGQLVAGDECDWFAIRAQRGEVLYFEGFGQRMGSPVDLQLSVLEATGRQELAQFGDELQNLGGALPTNHLDPTGRWVAPSDGYYLLAVRNLRGGLDSDPRRAYRLSVRREEPDYHLVATPHGDGPVGCNVPRGGRVVFDLLALRRRGLTGSIRIAARDLPAGVACPEVWLGPGVDRAMLVVSADRDVPAWFGPLRLDAYADPGSAVAGGGAGASPSVGRPVRGGTIVRTSKPTGWGRLTSEIPLAVAGDAPVRVSANGHEPLDHQLYGKLNVQHSPGGIVDVLVEIERRDRDYQAAVRLSGAGLPDAIPNQTALIPAGENKGYLSFYLPPTLGVGRYTLGVRAETTVPAGEKKTETIVAFSNPVVVDVQPAAFLVELDPFAPTRARRGETIQVAYRSHRRDGFIGKMHTELAAPGVVTDVPGLRGRGETFVGQTDKGSLQIIVNDDAPLGKQPFLRFFTVGVVEDEPIYQGSCLFPLEVVE